MLPVPAEFEHLPPSCEFRDWQVFTNGHHREGEFYSPEDVRRIAANFDRLETYLVPTQKLGHDGKQRAVLSLGLPNVGKVAGARADDAGNLFLHVVDVPTWPIGGMVNATTRPELGGRYRSGSAELKSNVPDPADPAKSLPGKVLTAVSLLGEEEPAVKGCRPPVAVFADGTPVPPYWGPLALPADALRPDADDRAKLAGAGFSAALCFSAAGAAVDETAVPTDATAAPAAALAQIGIDVSALGLTPEQQQALAAQLGGDQFAAFAKAKYAAPPADATPPPDPTTQMSDPDKKDDMDEAKLSAVFTKAFADAMKPVEEKFSALTSRMGAMEAAVSEGQKKADSEMASKFSAFEADLKARKKARVEAAVDRAVREMRLMPIDRAEKVAAGLARNDAATFSDGANKGRTDLDVWEAELLARPASIFSAAAVQDAAAKPARQLSPIGQLIVAGLRQDAPRAYARLTAAPAN